MWQGLSDSGHSACTGIHRSRHVAPGWSLQMSPVSGENPNLGLALAQLWRRDRLDVVLCVRFNLSQQACETLDPQGAEVHSAER